jgi:hypothetical protein
MSKKTVEFILMGLAIGVLIYWGVSGASLWTMTRLPVEVKDELFGTTSIEWRDGFRPGLEYTSPIVLVLLTGAGLLARGRRKAARQTIKTNS